MKLSSINPSSSTPSLYISNKFIDLLNVDTKDAKVLFIITAANDPDAVRILSGCLDDLTKCGITDNKIKRKKNNYIMPQRNKKVAIN